MFIQKSIRLRHLWGFTGHHLFWMVPLMTAVAALQFYTDMKWIRVPWQPIAIVGTAVAFYLGFKNNQAYDRLWEARKIWGAIVNSSRAWGTTLRGFVNSQFQEQKTSDMEINDHIKRMIYRHIAWLYVLRSQLLIPTQWEHISLGGFAQRWAERNRRKFGIGLIEDQFTEAEIEKFLSPKDINDIKDVKNRATQIIDHQSMDLKMLRQENLIDDFRHMELQKILYDFYVHQGKLERIKKFPLPRQYGAMSRVFVTVFIIIIPFGINPLFEKMGDVGFFMSIIISVISAWFFLVMELVGDYSENPFEGGANDIPMLSLCRTIEIDLREMIGETKLPPPIRPAKGILM